MNPISEGGLHVVGSIFVDDTDLEHFDMRRIETAEGAHAKFQESLINWGCLLIATGGALKPIKCFFQLISFRWNRSGTWENKDNKNCKEYKIVVPLEHGSFAKIEHLNIDTPKRH